MIKKLISVCLLIYTTHSLATLPNIVALVNDDPITKYDFESRKNMVVSLNDIDISDSSIEFSLNKHIVNLLIEEQLLHQYAEKNGEEVTNEQIDDAIRDIEKRNNMPHGHMKTVFKERNIEIASFRAQLAGEIIKNNIINKLSDTISVSPSEIDVAIINTSKPKFNVEVWSFTSRNNDLNAHKLMQNLKKKLFNCDTINEKLYEDFADAEKFDRSLEKMPISTQSIIHDTKVGDTSSIYQEDGRFKIVLVCKKELATASQDVSHLKSFLSHKKVSQKAAKFFKDLKSSAYTKIMIPY